MLLALQMALPVRTFTLDDALDKHVNLHGWFQYMFGLVAGH